MSDSKEQLTDLKKKLVAFAATISKHSTFVFFLIVSFAILAALLQSRGYLNPQRDEQRYNEGVASIQYKAITDESIERLKSAESGQDVDVNPSLVPNRNNPFTE